ncbi:putative Endoplasmic reticulum-Golgi intermediate compartment protein 3 [Paratrimastix pyriformis]|uniref:Endoplasmic reticulum-Golgi intermediate compartment protein 3 n=1 Tax=Paratrimastix pyriformis TaxID=342808 RepID=A0ABQ8UZP4_9EUKA|nr:putative Endoplasmic reticulum-Golgi intermediate compartment protein 3 [Paratrimastix pyriformis]
MSSLAASMGVEPSPKFLHKLKKLDLYARTDEDVLRKNSWSGVILTVVTSLIITVLFLAEWRLYRTTDLVHHLHVDTTYGEKLNIYINVTFPLIECTDITIDIIDVSGAQQIDVVHNLNKVSLTNEGRPMAIEKASLAPPSQKPPPSSLPPTDAPAAESSEASQGAEAPPTPSCGSCYGAELTPASAATREEVQMAYRKKNWVLSSVEGISQCQNEVKDKTRGGCNLYGFLTVNRVAGYFQIGPGRPMLNPAYGGRNVRVFNDFSFNLSHIIHKLSFGEEFPGVHNPLDGVHKILYGQAVGACKYFLKVVPTRYQYLDGRVLPSNQFSVTEHFQTLDENARTMPGVFFIYDLSPIMVELTEQRMSFFHFLTQVCAIVGGAFTVAGMLDGFIYRSVKTLRGKILLGKAH